MRILVLEDHPVTRKLIERRLIQMGHHVDAVDNGHQGFLLATARSYDVILSDIRMPHWDGFKFIQATSVVCPHVPIIIFSSDHDDSETTRKLSDFTNVIKILPKPLDFSSIQETLANLPTQHHNRLNKMARIVATIGPSSNTEETLGKMILAGMDVARLNFSHGSHQHHQETLSALRLAEQQWEKPIAVLVDLSGPKIRTGKMKDDAIELQRNSLVAVQAEQIAGIPERISTISPEILPDLKLGDSILLDDGLLELRVVKEGSEEVVCEVITGGKLKSNKGMNLPQTRLCLPSVTKKDWHDLDWALKNEVDYVALSFVRSAKEVLEIKNYIAASQNPDLKVVAKIEKPEAVKHISEIIQASDAIMIARGDMGVELPAARVPHIQKRIIKLCWEANVPVITATQMLDSMTYNSRPTRAEVTDVSVAIHEGTDAVMLSQETATGSDPVNVVRTMASIICEEESHAKMSFQHLQQLIEETSVNPVITSVSSLNNIKASLLFDPDGSLYPALSKWSRKFTSILITSSIKIARHASLFKNIVPLIVVFDTNRSELIFRAISLSKREGYIQPGDTIAIVEGEYKSSQGIKQVGTLQLVEVQ